MHHMMIFGLSGASRIKWIAFDESYHEHNLPEHACTLCLTMANYEREARSVQHQTQDLYHV